MYAEGRLIRTEMGYFSRKLVGGKKVNCFITGITDAKVGEVSKACQQLVVAR